jgi:hypothetical protein
MVGFEAVYKDWLAAKHIAVSTDKPIDPVLNSKFIDVLEKLYTVYQQGQLSDCNDDTQETNPIILNKSSLGTLQGGTNNNS